MKTALIIGIGSAGLRFAEILHRRHIEVAVFMHRKSITIPSYCKPVFSLDGTSYDAVIIASPTSTHMQYASFFADKKIPMFIEKPLSNSLDLIQDFLKKIKKHKTVVYVGFNMRHMPIVSITKEYMDNNSLGNILYSDFYAGQYLPFWRKKDYKKTYSVSRALGGGVALDLIHEIDLAYYFFPAQQFECLCSKRLGNITLDTEDYVVFRSTKFPVITITLDYLNHNKTRRYRLVGDKGSIECDIVNKRFVFTSISGDQKIITASKYFDMAKTYEVEMDTFISLAEGRSEYEIAERNFGIDALKTSVKGQSYEKT